MDPPGSTNVGLPPIFQVFGKAISSASLLILLILNLRPSSSSIPEQTIGMHANTVSPFAGISMLPAAKTTKKSGLTAPSAHLYKRRYLK